MAERRIITYRLGRPFMRLINRRAHDMGGNEYFEDCRAYVLQKVDTELQQPGATLSVEWLERILLTATVDDMQKLRSSI